MQILICCVFIFVGSHIFLVFFIISTWFTHCFVKSLVAAFHFAFQVGSCLISFNETIQSIFSKLRKGLRLVLWPIMWPFLENASFLVGNVLGSCCMNILNVSNSFVLQNIKSSSLSHLLCSLFVSFIVLCWHLQFLLWTTWTVSFFASYIWGSVVSCVYFFIFENFIDV